MNKIDRLELELEYYKKKCSEYEIALEMIAIKEDKKALKRLTATIKEKEHISAYWMLDSQREMLEEINKGIDNVLKLKRMKEVVNLEPELRFIQHNIKEIIKRY